MLSEVSYDKICKIYTKYFTFNYLGHDLNTKMACISLVAYITNEMRKKGKKVTCYDVLLQICKDWPDREKNNFLKSLGAVCEDLMYGCTVFPDFGLKPAEMPKKLKNLLDENYLPF